MPLSQKVAWPVHYGRDDLHAQSVLVYRETLPQPVDAGGDIVVAHHLSVGAHHPRFHLADAGKLVCSRQGTLWLATRDGGLNKFDPTMERAIHFTHNPDDPSTISDNDIRVMIVDRAGLIWLGTRNGGLNKFDPATETFNRYRHNPNDPASLGGDYVEAIFEDEQGVLWVGARKAGLMRFDRQNETFRHYRHDPDNLASLSDDTVKAIYEDEQGRLWVGTRNGLPN